MQYSIRFSVIVNRAGAPEMLFRTFLFHEDSYRLVLK